MRRLDKDEILALEKFLVEDSDEVVGIEIYKGLSLSSDSCSNPTQIIKYAVTDLAGGELIALDECRTLCAVVGNTLYYRDIYGNAKGLGPETNFEYFSTPDRKSFAELVKVLYTDSADKLPDEEILSLKTILVKDNKRVSGIRIERGHTGLGGTNRSGFSATSEREYTIQQLSGREPIWVMKSEICALVNDVLYFRCDDGDGNKRVYTSNHREEGRMMAGEGIAYDTASAARVVLLLK